MKDESWDLLFTKYDIRYTKYDIRYTSDEYCFPFYADCINIVMA